MERSIIRFNFKTPVHFGDKSQSGKSSSSDFLFQSDSFFSALVNEAYAMDGQRGVDKIINIFKGNTSFSSMLPYIGETYYLPKPIIIFDSLTSKENTNDSRYTKALKKLQYIPADMFSVYIKSMKEGTDIDVFNYLNTFSKLGEEDILCKNKIVHEENTNAEPFHVGNFSFNEGCGTYIIVEYENNDDFKYLQKLIIGLSFDGLGGKRSSGYGKFTFEIISNLSANANTSLKELDNLLNKQSSKYMSLSLSLFDDMDKIDLSSSFYSVIRRGGFIYSSTYNPAGNSLKKKEVYVFDVGSTFDNKYEGVILDVSNNGKHPVYKYLKPFYMGVE